MSFAAGACCAPPNAATVPHASSWRRRSSGSSVPSPPTTATSAFRSTTWSKRVPPGPGCDRQLRPRSRLVVRDVRPLPDPAGDPERSHRESTADPASKQVVERRRAIEHAKLTLAAAASGRTPSPTEIASATGLSVGCVKDARSASVATVSLDEPILPDGSPLRVSSVHPRAADPELKLLEHEQTKLLAAALADLPGTGSGESSTPSGASAKRRCRTGCSRPSWRSRRAARRRSAATRSTSPELARARRTLSRSGNADVSRGAADGRRRCGRDGCA